MAASFTPTASSWPSDPGGLVSWLWWAVASAAASLSTGSTPARTASKRSPATRSTQPSMAARRVPSAMSA